MPIPRACPLRARWSGEPPATTVTSGQEPALITWTNAGRGRIAAVASRAWTRRHGQAGSYEEDAGKQATMAGRAGRGNGTWQIM
jgi:hypothetical protein